MDEALPDPETPSMAYRLRRDAGGALSRLRGWWRDKRWFRRSIWALGFMVLAFFALWFLFARDLPDARTLLEYEPPLPTVVRDVNGQPVYSYARERRVQLQYPDFPPMLIRAYLAAEDKTFFSHHG